MGRGSGVGFDDELGVEAEVTGGVAAVVVVVAVVVAVALEARAVEGVVVVGVEVCERYLTYEQSLLKHNKRGERRDKTYQHWLNNSDLIPRRCWMIFQGCSRVIYIILVNPCRRRIWIGRTKG